jgi:hypothetical protein
MAARRPLLDRLAMRAAGVSPRESATAEHAADGSGPTMTRAAAVKGAAAAAALALLPLRLTDVAEAKKDCFEPCLGTVLAAGQRELRKCKPTIGDFYFGAIPSQIWCVVHTDDVFAGYRRECFKPNCGALEETIRHGGKISNFPVAPLELPPGTGSACENCVSVGGYCGTCPQGSTGNPDGKSGFFCGTPPVLPCRYCGGC